MVELTAILLNAQDLERRISQAKLIPNPEPSTAARKKNFWLQGRVRNYTQFTLKIRPPPYICTGKFETWPADIEPFSVGSFTMVNADNSPSGTTGGNAFTLSLQQGIGFDLAFGFTNPVLGAYKAAVVETTTPKDAYEVAVEGGNKITSKNEYQGVDADGNDMSIMFEGISTSGQQPVFTITQVKY